MTGKIGKVGIGDRVVSPKRTISEGEFTAMVNLSWETSPLHSDREYAKQTIFGERILGGPCIIPFVAGLAGRVTPGLWRDAGLEVIALVGIEKVRFTAPLFPGETIWVETEVASFRETSTPGRMIVTVKDTLYKGDRVAVLGLERIHLMKKNDSPAG